MSELLNNENTPPAELDKEEVIEFLGEEETEPKEDLLKDAKEDVSEKETKDKDAKEEDEEVDELKLIEEDLEEPSDDQLELITPVRRSEILKKYPKLFDDFPYLERAYYREQQYTEIFPTPQEAKDANDKASAFDNFERDVLQGNSEKLLRSIKEDDANAFAKFADNILPTLFRVDQPAFQHIVGNVIRQAVIGMIHTARQTQNESLFNAANLVNQFVFGSTEVAPPTPLAKQDTQNPDKDKLEKERKEFYQEKYQNAQSDISTKVYNQVKSTLELHIDPRKSMTEYVRGKAVEDALKTVNDLIGRDTRFQAINQRLWERAFQNGFDKDSLDKIRTAFLSKAKTLLPTVIKKARQDALRGSGKRVQDTDRKGPIPVGKPAASSSSGPKKIPDGMRSIDYLMAED